MRVMGTINLKCHADMFNYFAHTEKDKLNESKEVGIKIILKSLLIDYVCFIFFHHKLFYHMHYKTS